MLRRGLGVIATGGAVLVVALVLALLPLHSRGLSGNAVAPHYTGFTVHVLSSDPLPPTLATSALARYGIQPPRDVVGERRLVAGAVAAVGLVLLAAGSVRSRRQPAGA